MVTVEILSMVLFLVSKEDKVRFGGVEGWGYLQLIEMKRREGVVRNCVSVCARVCERMCTRVIGTITVMPGNSKVKREDICACCLFHICLIDLNKSSASLQ